MKRFAALCAALVLCFSGSISASGELPQEQSASVAIDVESMPDSDLQALFDAVCSEYFKRAGARSFVAGIGEYVAGVDIPAGVYSIRCAPGAKRTHVGIYVEKGVVTAIGKIPADADESEIFARVVIEDGYMVYIQDGAALFEPSTGGITFVD